MKTDREDVGNKDTELQGQYAIQVLRKTIEVGIVSHLPQDEYSLSVVEAPQDTGFDYGVNMNAAAKKLGISPTQVMAPLIRGFESQEAEFIEEVKPVGPFLNFKVNMSVFGNLVSNQVLKMGKDFGKENLGEGKIVIVDMSSPNIAKRMSYGHLRSTIIGDALANLYRSQGYEVVRDNHLGDWGTQFGKLIVAIKKWGNEKEILASDDPIGALQDLYVRFDKEATDEKEALRVKARSKNIKETSGLAEAIEAVSQEIIKRKKIDRSKLDMDKVTEDALDRVIESKLEKEGRAWFLRLEQGDKEARRLWRLCIDLSMKEFSQIYDVLGVGFEETLGESFYEDQLQKVIDIVRKSKAGKTSEGALVVDMSDKDLGVAIIQKSDGASVYMTRDLACAMYRQEKMKADKAIYVVGEDQKQYFQQLFEILKRLGYKIGDNAEHVYFGMVSLKEGRMSTRKGRVILLKDVIDEGLKRANEILEKRDSTSKIIRDRHLRDKIARQVAVGALKWNDLSQDAKRPIVFDWDKALNFEGNSAPYVQYTAIRANSILRASGTNIESVKNINLADKDVYQNPLERAVIRQLSEFPNAINDALLANSPAKIATYVYGLAKRFSALYTNLSVLKAESQELVDSRLKLVAATSQIITNALEILGIEVPEEM